VVETRQNPGENEGASVTAAPGAAAETPEDALEHVLDAWSSEPSSRQRYDRLRLERRDGQAIDVLVDAETARDLGDKLTIVAARARHRTRGAAGVPVDHTIDPGDAEDMARARKVIALLPSVALATSAGPKRIVYEDHELAPLVDEFRASREDVAKAHAMIDEQRAKHIRDMAAIAERHLSVAAELESVKADRDRLIAEAAQRDVGESSIDLSDPSEPASP
jgi:hypothetical protein